MVAADPFTGAPMAIDAAVAHAPAAGDRLASRAARDGVAAAAAAEGKRRRYPAAGDALVPAVVETGGRPGLELESLVRAYAGREPEEERPAAGVAAWRRISVAVQTGNAEMVLSATAGQRAGPEDMDL